MDHFVLIGIFYLMQIMAHIVYAGLCVAVLYGLASSINSNWPFLSKALAVQVSLVVALVWPIPAVGSYVFDVLHGKK